MEILHVHPVPFNGSNNSSSTKGAPIHYSEQGKPLWVRKPHVYMDALTPIAIYEIRGLAGAQALPQGTYWKWLHHLPPHFPIFILTHSFIRAQNTFCNSSYSQDAPSFLWTCFANKEVASMSSSTFVIRRLSHKSTQILGPLQGSRFPSYLILRNWGGGEKE